MCGRVNVADNEGIRVLLESMGMVTWSARDPRFNVAPTQTLDVVQPDGEQLSLAPMHWGFSLPMRGKSGKMIVKNVQNTRSDKVWSSALWKRHIAEHRVLVPVNGFYEWKRSNRKMVAAFYISPASSHAMFFAGIYRPAKEASAKSEVSIITTEANVSMSEVHDRMPVILSSENQVMAWLQDADQLSLDELMQPAEENFLKFVKVSDYVNKASNEGPECIEPVAA
ncbi:SOS response-associated peptidase [bacterium]|nr:SOS response-associated peptidase [bacterium]